MPEGEESAPSRPPSPKGQGRSYLGTQLSPAAYYEAQAAAYANPHALGVGPLLAWGLPALAAAWAACPEGPGRRLLDLGCGDGLATELLAPQGWRWVGVDASAGMVARYRAERGFPAQVGGFGDPLPEACAMVACHALHLASPEEAAMLGWRLAEAGVRCALVVGPFKERPRCPGPYYELLDRASHPVGPKGKALHAALWGRAP